VIPISFVEEHIENPEEIRHRVRENRDGSLENQNFRAGSRLDTYPPSSKAGRSVETRPRCTGGQPCDQAATPPQVKALPPGEVVLGLGTTAPRSGMAAGEAWLSAFLLELSRPKALCMPLALSKRLTTAHSIPGDILRGALVPELR